MGADLSGGNAVVGLCSDDGVASSATRYSTATLAIPQTGGTVPLQAEFLPSLILSHEWWQGESRVRRSD